MQSAKEKTTIARFKEDVNFAYMELYSEGAEKGNYSEITVDKIIPRLKQNYGYTDENLHTQILGTVTLTVPEEGNIEMATDSSKEVRVVTSDDNTKNYVKLDGMWYEFSITGNQVTVGKGNKEIPGESENVNSSQLQAISDNEDVKVSASTETFIVTITSNENPTPQNEPAVITVSYGGSKIEINVTVKQAYTLTVNSNNEEYGTVSVSPTSTNNKYIEGTQVTVTANVNEGYVFKGWYTGNDTTDENKKITGAGSSYQVTLNADTTLTAKFDESAPFVQGFVDDLGTRATIYLYGNPSVITSGTITITMPDSSTDEITAIANATNIGPNTDETKYYATYTVAKNGTYTFSATDGISTTYTRINVENIETFTPIESVKVNGQSVSYYNSENKAYSYNGAAVPKGYYVDTNSTVENGLVITDDIDSEGYSTGNEWVWVPVNSTVGNTDYYATESSATALAGATDVTYTKYSKLYSFFDTERYSYGTFYFAMPPNSGTLTKPSNSGGWREVAVLTYSSYADSVNSSLIKNRTTGMAFEDVTGVATQYVSDYNSMVQSVDKYHGFYIGRYELANIGGIVKEQPGDSKIYENWYSLYNICLTFGISDVNSMQITETSMMYGALWDATMQWFASSGISVGDNGKSTIGYGNYKMENIIVSDNKGSDKATISIKTSDTYTLLQTGQTSYTRRKNIYDLAGNCIEFTQEGYESNMRVTRGGHCADSSRNDTFPATRGWLYPTEGYNRTTSRPQLYIK